MNCDTDYPVWRESTAGKLAISAKLNPILREKKEKKKKKKNVHSLNIQT